MSIRFSAAAVLAAGLLAAPAGLAQEPSWQPATTPANPVREKMVLIPYQVSELVIPVGCGDSAADKAEKSAKEQKPAGTRGQVWRYSATGGPTSSSPDDLIRLIQNTIAPRSWQAMGGPGSIDYFPMTMTLVINQTPSVQEQIADLLAALRREQDTQVALEVRLVSIPDGFCNMGIDFSVNIDGKAAQGLVEPPAPVRRDTTQGLKDQGAFLTDIQLFQFLEAAQGDQRTNVMQAPKLTMLNGQTAVVDCTEKQSFVTGCQIVRDDERPVIIPKAEEVVTGFHMSARPSISADRRSVELDLKIKQSDLASSAVPMSPVTVQVPTGAAKSVPFTQFIQMPKVNTIRMEKTLTIPDGGTALLGGFKKVSEVQRVEYGPPVLSDIPYVNRLFKNVGISREAQSVYVLVTARVITPKEDERQQARTICPNPECVAEESAPPEKEKAEARPDHMTKAVAELLTAYDEACAAGHTREAARLARAALVLDPTCFARQRGR